MSLFENNKKKDLQGLKVQFTNGSFGLQHAASGHGPFSQSHVSQQQKSSQLYSSEWETTTHLYFAFPFAQRAKEKLLYSLFTTFKKRRNLETDNVSQ